MRINLSTMEGFPMCNIKMIVWLEVIEDTRVRFLQKEKKSLT